MIKRIITEEILTHIGSDQTIVIQGARHVGTTELLLHIEQVLKDRHEATVFINLEQNRHDATFRDPKLLIRFLREQCGLGGGKKIYLFLNEIHFIKHPDNFLKEVYDLSGGGLQMIVAGSVSINNIHMKKDFTELADKKVMFNLRHLSFREYLKAKSDFSYQEKFRLMEAKNLQDFYTTHKDDLKEHFKNFIYWGGYPDVAEEPNSTKKYVLLGDIVHRYIEKDISSLLRLENVEAYIQLMEILSHEVGNLLNHHDLSTRLNIHKKTLDKYLDIISGTFTFEFVPPYFTNQKKELAKMRKVYAHDAGIVSYFHHQMVREPLSFFPNVARLKNFLYTELRKMDYNKKLFFYRTIAKAEIDFVINAETEIMPIKIKLGKKVKRVPVVMKNFVGLYENKVKKAIIVTEDDLHYDGLFVFVPIMLLPFIDFEM